jgi:hypothetical protein
VLAAAAAKHGSQMARAALIAQKIAAAELVLQQLRESRQGTHGRYPKDMETKKSKADADLVLLRRGVLPSW